MYLWCTGACLWGVRGTDAAEVEAGQGTARPNIVCILADDLGYGDLSCYGATDLQTPAIDRCAAAGMRFTNAYANCPVCSPTRAALLSGRYPEIVGVPGVIRTHADNSWGDLSADARLLPMLLSQAGYDTAIVGKWHLGLTPEDHPLQHGFGMFHGFLGDMMDDYFHHRRHDNNYMRRQHEVIDPEGHATDLFTDWACEYLSQRERHEKPFFLYLAYNAPHTPIQPPESWLQRVRDREPEQDPRRSRLVALIEHMDDGVGRVLQTLEQAGLSDNTLVVFTSDNGGQLSVGARNGAVRDGKGSMYEGGLKIPACARWPGRIPPRSTSAGPILSMDWYPTFCEVAGVEVEHPIDGMSIVPLWRAPRDTSAYGERDLFFIRREGGLQYNGLEVRALRRGPWKLVQNSPYQPWELYHLERDPLETRELSQEEPQMYRAMCAALRHQIQRGGAVPWQAPGRRFSETPRP